MPELGGYNYEFLAVVPERLKCSICLLTLKDPVQVKRCGHRFCKLCINPILKYVSLFVLSDITLIL